MPSKDRVDLSADRAWLNAFRAGEAVALERVFRAYASYIWAIAHRALGASSGRVDVDGVVQEVFLRAFSDDLRMKYDGLRPYSSFLAGVARNVALDAMRRFARHEGREVVSDDPTDPTWHPDEELPEATALNAETRALAREFLATLPDDEREFVQARFLDELTQDEAAAALRSSRQRIRTLEHRVRDKLRGFLLRRRIAPEDHGDQVTGSTTNVTDGKPPPTRS